MDEPMKTPSPQSSPAGGRGSGQAAVIETDKYHGVGGSYTVDPVTGKRLRAGDPAIEPAATLTKG